MHFTRLCATFILLGSSAGAQPPSQSPKKIEHLIAEAHQRMGQRVETKNFHEKMLFAKFLRLLEKELSKDTKFSIHFEREAFGKDVDRILSEEIALPEFPARMNAFIALRLALAQTHAGKHLIEFTARPGTLVITTRDRALFTVTYEIGDLLKHTSYLDETIRNGKLLGGVFFLLGPNPTDPEVRADPAKPEEWIVQHVMACGSPDRSRWRDGKPPSTLQVVNGTKLIVHTAPSVHEEISQLLAMMRRLFDVAVVMSAKVYELDHKEYASQFAASFVASKDKSARRLVSTVTNAQWKLLQSRKPILESDPDKLRPNARAAFLARKNVYQYQARPGDANPTLAFEGFFFSVRPIISPDRRCLRLELFHEVEQLVKLTKGTMIELKTGKELPIELPNVRKSTASGTIEIHDGQPILLAIDYRPKDKVWLVVAEPRIYIEVEEEQLRKGSIKRMPPADEKPAPSEPPEPPPVHEKPPPPPMPLPDEEDVKQILQAVIESVLTDPEIKDFRDFYGVPGDNKFALVSGRHFDWPKKFRPAIAGMIQEQSTDSNRCPGFRPRLMGIRIDGLDLKALKAGAKEVDVGIAVENVGGAFPNGVIGGGRVSFVAHRDGTQWKAKWTQIED